MLAIKANAAATAQVGQAISSIHKAHSPPMQRRAAIGEQKTYTIVW